MQESLLLSRFLAPAPSCEMSTMMICSQRPISLLQHVSPGSWEKIVHNLFDQDRVCIWLALWIVSYFKSKYGLLGREPSWCSGQKHDNSVVLMYPELARIQRRVQCSNVLWKICVACSSTAEHCSFGNHGCESQRATRWTKQWQDISVGRPRLPSLPPYLQSIANPGL